MSDLSDAIRRVRDSGKPVLAYATAYTDDSYQLAAAASEVWLNPLGLVPTLRSAAPQSTGTSVLASVTFVPSCLGYFGERTLAPSVMRRMALMAPFCLASAALMPSWSASGAPPHSSSQKG